MWSGIMTLDDQFDDDFDGSNDGDSDARRHAIALRRAASLEALKAYGGCFTSGFFAMQQPLPRRPIPNLHLRGPFEDDESLDLRTLASEMSSVDTGSVKTASSTSHNNAGCPRPDSDTLSHIDVKELKPERRWRWRSLGKKKRCAGAESKM